MIKYLVFPGLVTSKHDGDQHFVGAFKLMHLYGVNPLECKIIRDRNDLLGIDPNKYIHLGPRYSGDYTLPEAKESDAH